MVKVLIHHKWHGTIPISIIWSAISTITTTNSVKIVNIILSTIQDLDVIWVEATFIERIITSFPGDLALSNCGMSTIHPTWGRGSTSVCGDTWCRYFAPSSSSKSVPPRGKISIITIAFTLWVVLVSVAFVQPGISVAFFIFGQNYSLIIS
jgi:hypothetical protein